MNRKFKKYEHMNGWKNTTSKNNYKYVYIKYQYMQFHKANATE